MFKPKDILHLSYKFKGLETSVNRNIFKGLKEVSKFSDEGSGIEVPLSVPRKDEQKQVPISRA